MGDNKKRVPIEMRRMYYDDMDALFRDDMRHLFKVIDLMLEQDLSENRYNSEVVDE